MAYQGRVWESVIRLTAIAVPVTGVVFTNLQVKYRKGDDLTFTTKTMITGDWSEISNGFYILRWSESDMAEIGEFLFWVKSISGTPFDDMVEKIVVEPQPLAFLAAPEVCIVSGNIVDIGGDPGTDSLVAFRAAKTPSVISTSFVEGKVLRTALDAFGNFSVALLREKKVIVEIERSGIRHTITVPDQETANLVDLLPPIVD